MQDYSRIADQNLQALRDNKYPGRGVGVGVSEDGKFVIQACWTMGRSEESRNRVYLSSGGEVRTAVANEADLKPDTDLHNIIYPAMLEDGLGMFAVSNGHHTQDIVRENDLHGAFTKWKYEDDSNHTPRIAASCDIRDGGIYQIAMGNIVKAADGDEALPTIYPCYNIPDGFGFFLTTYEGDGKPLPSFRDRPFLLPLQGNLEAVMEVLWDSLDQDNRVSIAVKFIEIATGQSETRVENKYEYAPAGQSA